MRLLSIHKSAINVLYSCLRVIHLLSAMSILLHVKHENREESCENVENGFSMIYSEIFIY